MSEVLKLSYRGFGGLIAFLFIFTFAISSFAFFISGIVLIALSIYIQIYPSILLSINFMFFTSRITDPIFGSILSFLFGIVIIIIGSVFLALTSIIWKYSLKLDRGLTTYVDANVPKTGELIDRVRTPKVEPTDKLSKLERLGRLREKGVLTESEFLQQKQLILKETEQ